MSDNPESAAPEASKDEAPAKKTQSQAESQMETTPATEPAVADKPKGKTGKKVLIGALVVLGLSGVAAGVTFALMNTVFKQEDVVAKAISKVLNGETPVRAEVEGKISFDGAGGSIQGIKSASVDLNTKFDRETKASDVDLKLKAEPEAGSALNFQLGLKTTSGGDAFVKIDGMDSSIFSLMPSSDLSGQESLAMAASVLSLVNGNWIKIPASASSSLSLDSFGGFGMVDGQAQCLVSAMNNISDYGKNLTELYNNNQFITYSTDNITIAKRKDTLYRLGIDSEKMASFINGLSSTKLVSDLSACAGDTVAISSVSAEQINAVTGFLPTMYAEIDSDYNFTRLYFDTSESPLGLAVKADFVFSYPTSITVDTPTSYKDLTEVVTSLMSSYFTTNNTTSGNGVNFQSLLNGGSSSSEIDFESLFGTDGSSLDLEALLR